MDYLYPGQQQMVYVPNLRKTVPYFETLDEISDDHRGYAAVNQDNVPQAQFEGQTLFSRPIATSGNGVPGVLPLGAWVLMCLVVLLAIITVIAVCVITYLNAMQANQTVTDPYLTPCPSGDCYSSKFMAGTCWYRDNCCTSEVTPLDPQCVNGGGLPGMFDDLIKGAVTLAAIGVGAYITFKFILPSLSKKKEDKK